MKTIICGQFKQETNRYAAGVSDTTAYKNREYYWGEDAVRAFAKGTKNELGAFFDVLDDKEDCRLIPVMALNAPPGPVTAQKVWDRVLEVLLQTIAEAPSVDGILLALHGAMVTQQLEDGEGELLERIRAAVGPNVPIIASLDLHANITSKMIEHATALFPCDNYPHTDIYDASLRAAQTMWQAVNKEVTPVMRYRKLDMLFPFVITSTGPIVPLLQTVQDLRATGTLISASICHGFFHSDIHDLGAAVLAIADGDGALAQKHADELAARIWKIKEQFDRKFYTPEEAVAIALQASDGPVVLADVADNPGSGATMDSVVLLQQLLDMGATDTAFAAICDPEVVMQAREAGVGAVIDITLGGKQAPEITGGPLCCTATVEKLTDGRFSQQGVMCHGLTVNFGHCALLRIGGVQVIICSNLTQPYDLEIYRHCGIDPTAKKLLVVKSAVHFRADFGTIATQILDVETPALGCMRPQMLPLAHCRRPIYPLDAL